jgi:hypothetical protein
MYRALLGAAFAPACAATPTPEQTFNEVYGTRLKSVSTTAQRVDFAKQLLSDAGGLNDDKPFQTYLYLKILELAGTEPAGYALGRQALESLEKARPEMREIINEKMLALLEKQYHSGPLSERRQAAELYIERANAMADDLLSKQDVDGALAMLQKAAPAAQIGGRDCSIELQSRIKALHQRQSAEKLAATLKAKLEQDSSDTKSADELVRLLTVELDRPAEAVSYLTRGSDTAARAAVPLAARDPASLTPDQLLVAGNWYRTQAPKATDLGRPVALTRAQTYYTAFLARHAKEDAAKLEAKVALAEIVKELAKEHRNRSVDLLTMIDGAKDAVLGPWQSQQGKVSAMPAGIATLAIPYAPPEEYNLKVKFEKPENTTMVVLFADHNRLAGAAVGAYGVYAGFDRVRGKRCWEKENPTSTRYPASETPGPHVMEVRVRSDSLSLLIDGTLVTRYFTDGSDLLAPPESPIAGYPLGLGIGQSAHPTIFDSVELVEIGGKGRSLNHKQLKTR